MAWLTGWGRRKSKNIAGSTAGAQANYQMCKIRVHKDTGTDTSSGANDTVQHAYVGANVRDDFGDVVFTKADETTLLDFWMETYVSGDYADFYVEVDSIPESPDTVDIYVYYDKGDETTSSSGANTFPDFFDDFNDGNYTGWTVLAGTWSVANGYLEGVDGGDDIYASMTQNQGFWEWRHKILTPASYEYYGRFWHQTADAAHNGASINSNWGLEVHDVAAIISSGDEATMGDGDWHDISIGYDGVQNWLFKIDGVTQTILTTGTPTTTPLYYVVQMNSGKIAIDNVRNRQFANPEPSWGAFGSEETAPVVGHPTQLRTRLIPGMNYIGVPA